MTLERIAVLADIHGNLPALEAVLRDVDRAGVDAIVVNGDIAAGPMPAATLDLLASLGDRVVWVHGNAERELVAAYDGQVGDDLPPPVRQTVEAAAAALSRCHRDLIDGLPMSVTLDIDGLGPVRCCHATTRSDTEIVLVDSPGDRYVAAFADVTEQLVVLGHTHMPFDRLVDRPRGQSGDAWRCRFVNPGSVGMPYGGTGACWALVGPDVTLRHTVYDLDAAAATLRAGSNQPAIEEFVHDNLLTTPSAAEALAVFTKLATAAARR